MNLYQPTITGSLSVSGSVNISGSITIAGGGTISGTASIATTALTASFVENAQTASYVLNAVSSSFALTASSADNLLVRNTLTAQTLVVQTITSSVDFVTGSTRFGSISANTHVFTGSLLVSGSGFVGIGTNSPIYSTTLFSAYSSGSDVDVDVKNNTSAGAANFYLRSQTDGTGEIRFTRNSDNSIQGRIQFNQTNGSMAFRTGGNDNRLFISGSGNVGIGTVTPNYPLTIKCDTSANGLNIVGRSSGDSTLSFYAANGTTPYVDWSVGATYVQWDARNSQDYKWYCNSSLKMVLTTGGTLQFSNNPTSNYEIDSSTRISIAPGGTFPFANFSGMVVVTNMNNGATGIWLVGSGTTSLVSYVSTTTGLGTFAYTSGNAGYTWTSNYSVTANYGFFAVRTRPEA